VPTDWLVYWLLGPIGLGLIGLAILVSFVIWRSVLSGAFGAGIGSQIMRKFFSLLCYWVAIALAWGNFFVIIWTYRNSLLVGQGIGSMAGAALFLTLFISLPLWLLARWICSARILTSLYWSGLATTLFLMLFVPVYFSSIAK
jgi:hypothetical protein